MPGRHPPPAAPQAEIRSFAWQDAQHSFRKKDTQRTAELRSLQLPRDGRPVPFTVAAELAAGHELLVVPMLRGLHHNAVNIEIDDLAVTREETTRRE